MIKFPSIFHKTRNWLNILKTDRQREYIVDDKRKLVYLIISKNACSSIKGSFINKGIYENQNIHRLMAILGYRKTELTDEQEKYFKFTFVRNPFDRLVSTYENKYHQTLYEYDAFFYNNYLYGFLKDDRGFDNYVKRVCMIPDMLLEKHLYPQHYYVYENNKTLVDFIGKYENLDDEFKTIQEKYDLFPLPHINKSNRHDYRDYYTLQTAKMVYKKYKKDFKYFGYEDTYRELIEYIKNKHN